MFFVENLVVASEEGGNPPPPTGLGGLAAPSWAQNRVCCRSPYALSRFTGQGHAFLGLLRRRAAIPTRPSSCYAAAAIVPTHRLGLLPEQSAQLAIQCLPPPNCICFRRDITSLF
jgi:hypothetical protein